MITARHNTFARRVVYYDGGLYGPFPFYRWAVTPSGTKLPHYVYPILTMADDYVVHEVALVDVPILISELPNLPYGGHDVWVQGSNDDLLYIPLYRDTLYVYEPKILEPLAL